MLVEQLSPDQPACDFCIVGSGPVGMALALELDELGQEILLLESGGSDLDSKIADASRAQIVDQRRHADMSLTVCRALGGTSWTWGGRCVAYNDADFAARNFVPDAAWPITHDTIRPWYATASKYLLCGNDHFNIPYTRALTGGLTMDSVERWATTPRLIEIHRDALIRSQRIKISLRSTVVGLYVNEDGSWVESLEVATPAGPRTVKARNFILALGGVETSRFLLSIQQKNPRLFGGIDGPLGRYYMGHLSGKIATLQLRNPESVSDLDFHLDDGAWYRRRLMLTDETQLNNKLLNAVFWADNPAFYDPSHRSPVLSATFLAIAFPPTGRRLLSEAIRLAHTGPRPYKIAAHLRNAILGAPGGAVDLYRVLRDRFLAKPRKPGFIVPNKGGSYALHYHAEQAPNPLSRITLTAEKDAFGMPRASIDMRYSCQDVDSVLESHRLLDQALRANQIGQLVYWNSPEETRAWVEENAGDGFHQIGGVRMGTDPSTSVVDPDLNVHGLSNLSIASSAVFPSGSQANSTLLAVALAMRLAHRLANSTSRP
ncbi:GMC oxidoreductase [Telmatobacter sp. DSM 110680]|uniref:GMC oxidoreductase n=1 Tax=Telmatobacter sp. DSM 110680 TaxID=3036704 RepID=A0AAU7DJ34_9BACT